MDLGRWWSGLNTHLFSNVATAVRLYCADGQVLYEIYEECRKEGDPVLNKEDAARDFFSAVITYYFRDRAKALHHPIRISEIAEYYEGRANNGGYDWDVLPLCFFFASVWSIDFQDPEDPSNDSDYRTRRFAEALRWGGAADLVYERGTGYFSDGIVRLFNLLARQYRNRLFMPSEDFEYRGSHADGITLSHSFFRYGDIANIYTIFSDWKLYPGEDPATYSTLFKEIADKELDTAWRMSRQCADDNDYLVNAIKELYCGWDGKPVPRYRGYIKKPQCAHNDCSRTHEPDVRCKPYWALIRNEQFNFFTTAICLDQIFGIDGELVASSGDASVAIPCGDLGVTCFQWMENTDGLRNINGWGDLKSDRKIVFDHNEVRLGEIPAFYRCFDGHAVILLQSYIPPAGGNPIWRLMIGSQGADLWTRDNIWQGDGRRNDTQYAVMSPSRLTDKDVQCEGLERLEEMGVLVVGAVTYHVHRLHGNLTSDLKVNEATLFNFGVRPDDKRGVSEFFVTKELRIRKLFGREFVAPPRLTVFYLPKERRIAVYCPRDVVNSPNLYEASANTIKYCEIDPTMRKHQIKDFVFEESSGLWITQDERDDNGDEPIAIGMETEDDGRIFFAPVDNSASEYLNSWKGYFLPMLDNVKGAIEAKKWRASIHELLTASQIDDDGIRIGENSDMTSLASVFGNIQICDADEKMEFISEIGAPLRDAVVRGMPQRPGFGCFTSAFQKFPDGLGELLSRISNTQSQLGPNEYFAWSLILLSIYKDRGDMENRLKNTDVSKWNKLMAFKKTLNGFYPTLEPEWRAWYCPRFLCEGIVHAILDGISDEEAKRIVSRGFALADRIVSQLA